MAGPRHALARFQDGDLGLRAAGHRDQAGHRARARSSAAPAIAATRRARPPSPTGRSSAGRARAAQPRQAQRQQVAALGGDQRMQFVEDDVAQIRRKSARASLWRAAAPAVPASSAGCPADRASGAGACDGGVSPVRVSIVDRQAHLVDRLRQIALDVDGQRLQRRDVERVDAAFGFARPPLRARRRSIRPAGSRPASCPRRSARSAAPIRRPGMSSSSS